MVRQVKNTFTCQPIRSNEISSVTLITPGEEVAMIFFERYHPIRASLRIKTKRGRRRRNSNLLPRNKKKIHRKNFTRRRSTMAKNTLTMKVSILTILGFLFLTNDMFAQFSLYSDVKAKREWEI